MEVHVNFRGRKPVPQHVDIGMERENKVTVLCFEGLPKMDGSTGYLHIDLGNNSDVIEYPVHKAKKAKKAIRATRERLARRACRERKARMERRERTAETGWTRRRSTIPPCQMPRRGAVSTLWICSARR